MNINCRILFRCFAEKNVMLKRTVLKRYSGYRNQMCMPPYPKVMFCLTFPPSRVLDVQYLTTNIQYSDGLESLVEYETVSEETLHSITERFEKIIDIEEKLADSDVNYSDGVLTINLGKFGIYVINKQTPNRQIWLSSPVSGPKRFDFKQGRWIYKHEQVFLHDILSQEISSFISKEVDFSDCSYGI